MAGLDDSKKIRTARATDAVRRLLCTGLFVMALPPAVLWGQGGLLSVRGGSATSGSVFLAPVTLNLNAGVAVESLAFGVRVIPRGAAPPPTASMSFARSLLQAPNLVDPTATTLAVAWLLPPLNPALQGATDIGIIGVVIPSTAQVGHTYTIQVTGAQATVGGTEIPLSPGPDATLTVNSTSGGNRGAGDYAVSIFPASQSVAAGAVGSYAVTITPTGGFTDSVALNCDGLPAGASCIFSPNPVRPGMATLTLSTPPGTPPGSVIFTVTGASGSARGSTSANLTVIAPGSPADSGVVGGGFGMPDDFSLSVAPPSQSVISGGEATYVVTIAGASELTDPLHLSCGGSPAGTTCNFSRDPAQPGAVILTVNAGPPTPPAGATFNVIGARGALIRSSSIHLNIADFAVEVSPDSQSVTPGMEAAYETSINVPSLDGATEIGGKVNLSCDGLPMGASCSFSANPSAPGSTQILTVRTEASTPGGSVSFLVKGDSGSVSRSTNATLTVAGAAPPPAFTRASIVNGASFREGISAGSVISIFGTNLTSHVAGVVEATSFPLPTQLRGTSVTVNGVPAPLFSVAKVGAQEQINLQVPVEVAGQSLLSFLVNNNGALSEPVSINLAPASPGLFTFDGIHGAILHGSDFKPVTASAPASKGEEVVLYGTGLGRVNPRVGTGDASPGEPLSRTTTTPVVRVGGTSAPVVFSGLAPGFVGLYQVNIRVPDSVPSGSLEVVLQTAGFSSNAVQLPVQ